MAKKKSIQKQFAWAWTGRFNLGVACLVLGIYLLARDLGWIPLNFPVWPIVLIAIGVYFLIPRK